MSDLAKVKRNIQRMIDQGAPETDIDAYVSSEGVTIEQLQAHKNVPVKPLPGFENASPELLSQVEAIKNDKSLPALQRMEKIRQLLPRDNARYIAPDQTIHDADTRLGGNEGYAPNTVGSFGMGVGDTTAFGFADEINAGIDTAIGRGSYSDNLNRWRGQFDLAERQNPGSYLTGQIAGAVAPALISGGGSSAPTIGGRILSGAKTGAASGALYGVGSGEGTENRMTEGLIGGLVGAGTGGVAPIAAKAIGGVSRIFRPNSISPERAGLLSTLEKEGVNLTAGQKTGSRGMRNMESELGGGKIADMMEKQGEQFTNAVMKRVGGAGRATPENIDQAVTAMGKKFDDLAKNSNIKPDQKLMDDLKQVADDYGSVTPLAQQPGMVQNTLMDIVDQIQSAKSISGEFYKTTRSRLERIARKSADPEYKIALRGINNALDDAMERSNPADKAEWSAVRNQYRNFIVLEQAATAAGSNAAEGLISPSALLNAVKNKQGRRNYARGIGDYAELARAGEALLKSLPDSGTSSRLRASGVTNALTAGVGGGVLGSNYGPDQWLSGGAGAALGLLAPQAAGRMLLSGPVQKYLSPVVKKGTGKVAKQINRAIEMLIARGGLLTAPEFQP